MTPNTGGFLKPQTLHADGTYKNALNFYNPAGPLSGKTTVTVLAWVIAWAVFHNLWKDKQVDFSKTSVATLILITLGLLGTFPPFLEVFAE